MNRSLFTLFLSVGLCLRSATRPILISMFALVGAQTNGHHSGVNFDRAAEVELRGSIVDYGFKNPHVYIEVAVEDSQGEEQIWLVEGHSVTGARRLGWSPDSLEVGEQVTITGYPDRDPAKNFAMLNYLQKEEGSYLYAFRKPTSDLPEEPVALTPSQDFSGTWDLDLTTFNFLAANGQPDENLPLTLKGRDQREAFSIEDNPALNCQTVGVPRMVLWPYGYNISRYDDRVLIEKEHEGVTRTIYLNTSMEQALLDADGENPYIGTSVGRFESPRHLVVETAGFAQTPWGLSSGLDSSPQKKVIENYELSDDGLSIEVSYWAEDSDYLDGPLIVSGRYQKAEDRDFANLPCDPETANRHALD